MLQITFEDFPILQTKRLLLRKIRMEDVTAFYELRSNDEFMSFLDRDKPKDVREIESLVTSILKQFEENEAICWVLSLEGNDDFMGTISYWRIDKAHFRAEIGYGIHPDFQQKGYMDEAMKAVIDFGFKSMNLHSIEANINPTNIGSIKLVEKNGFIQEAYFKENYFYNGQFLDSAIYSLLNKA